MNKPIEKIFYTVNKIYSLTINFNDSYHSGRGGILKSFNLIHNAVHEYIDYDDDTRYILHFDISEPKEMRKGKFPRLHLHGCIKFKSSQAIRYWLLYSCNNLSKVASIYIDTIDNVEIWEKYCKKYDHITDIKPIQYRMAWDLNKKKDLIKT